VYFVCTFVVCYLEVGVITNDFNTKLGNFVHWLSVPCALLFRFCVAELIRSIYNIVYVQWIRRTFLVVTILQY
jgi:uncharacterized membrane protein